jgi:hypothetical protein
MMNDFNAKGIAIDISFEQLRTADHFAELFNRPKLPVRVCCDANHLPVKVIHFLSRLVMNFFIISQHPSQF